MKLYDLKYWLADRTIFSVNEISKAIILVALATIGLFAVAFVTFESEYFSGVTLEKLLEYSGILNKNWMVSHHELFLHEVQVIFMATFILEITFILSRYMRGWKL